jgi:hypothetical protein
VIDQTVAHHAAIDVAILNFRQRGWYVRIGHPAAQGQIAMLPLNRQRLFQKRRTADRAQPALFLAACATARYWRITLPLWLRLMVTSKRASAMRR